MKTVDHVNDDTINLEDNPIQVIPLEKNQESNEEFPSKIAIIGAGLNGLFTAYHIIKVCEEKGIDCPEITIYDRSDMMSSLGDSRIDRASTYEDEQLPPIVMYSNKVLKVLAQDSQKLDLDQRFSIEDFLIPAKCITTGNNHKVIDDAQKAAESSGVPHRVIKGDDMKEEFPLLNLDGFEKAVVENEIGNNDGDKLGSAAVMNPNKIMKCLTAILSNSGKVTFKRNNQVQAVIETDDNKAVVMGSDGEKEFDKVSVVAGAWTATLFPEDERLQNIHPEIAKLFYFKINPKHEEKFKNFPTEILKIKGASEEVRRKHAGFFAKHPELLDEKNEANFYLMIEKNEKGECFLKVGLIQDYVDVEKDPYEAFKNLDKKIKDNETKLVEDFVEEFFDKKVVEEYLDSPKAKTVSLPTSFVHPDKLPIIGSIRPGSTIEVFYGDNYRGAKTSAGITRAVALMVLGFVNQVSKNFMESFGIDRSSLQTNTEEKPPLNFKPKEEVKQLQFQTEQQIGS